MKQNETDSGGIKSVDNVFDIIETLHELDGAGVTELANHLGIPKSTAHTYLSTLEGRQYVTKDDGEYNVSLLFLDHGIYAKENLELTKKSRTSIEQLAEQTGEATWLIVEEHGLAVSLDLVVGDLGVQTFSRVGNRTHMHTLATGKAILAEFPEERVSEIIERHGLPEKTESTITDQGELFEELDEIRDQGYAMNSNESIYGEHGAGVSIVTDGKVHGAIGISVPSNRMQQDQYREDVPQLLMGAANEIELKLQYED